MEISVTISLSNFVGEGIMNFIFADNVCILCFIAMSCLQKIVKFTHKNILVQFLIVSKHGLPARDQTI